MSNIIIRTSNAIKFIISGIGPQGPKGDKGDSGDAGPQGETGPQGPQGDPGTDATMTALLNTQIGSYQLVLSDAGKIVIMNTGSDNYVQVPLNSNVAFEIGTQIIVAQYGTGQIEIQGQDVNVVIRSANNYKKLQNQYSGATLVKIDTNEWFLFGDLTA